MVNKAPRSDKVKCFFAKRANATPVLLRALAEALGIYQEARR